MAKALRVFEIAKDLGVPSKAIVDKCAAEGVPGITNHMSVVKVGLAATIREWFSISHNHVTAVEESAPVDQAMLLKASRRKAKSATAQPPAQEPPAADSADADTATATLEPAPVQALPEAPATPAVPTPVAPPPAVDPEAIAAKAKKVVREEKTEAPEAPKVEPPRAPVKPVGRVNVPDRPQVVRPAGEQLQQPKTAQLKGPRVVRVEKPENLAPPRPARPAGPRGPAPAGGAEREGSGDSAITRSRGPVRGRGAGAGPAEPEAPGADRNKTRRSLTSRRGRSAQALPSGPSKFSEADLAELDAKLNRATGFVKQRRRDLRKGGALGVASQAAVVTGGKVEVAEPITIKELSAATGIKSADVIKYLFKKGVMATINSAIAAEAAMEVALEYDIELVVKEKQTAEQKVVAEFEQRETLDERPRPPVVTVLGHVDHGKTSLLDRIRKADVAAHEDGGITQHVGAYRVTVDAADGSNKTVVFLDTPGHAAFTNMRARGANLTDLVVLVVAADDGVMPQTIESINHAKAARVPIIVALNKIDKPEATPESVRKVFGQLAEHGLNPVEWGGETEVVRVSATTGQGVTDLLEVLDYQAELLELKADFGGPARGTVIEAQMQAGRGAVARVLVEQGQMRVGDFIVIGRAFGRVRDMTDDRGRTIREAGPATPLELSGIDEVPDAGDKFYITDSLQKAEQVAKQTREVEREKQLASKNKVTLDNFAASLEAGKQSLLRVVLKADVQGSVETLRKQLEDLGNTEVAVRVLHAAVGGITESDILLADASDAVVVGFHVVAPSAVRDIAEERRVDVRLYRIIYELIDDVKKALEGMLNPSRQEEQIGQAQVREVFKITKLGNVAGCLVTEGSMNKAMKVRVVRDGVVVTDDRKFESLRRVKEDVGVVRVGTECGIRVAGFEDIKPGDVLVCYQVVNVARTLG